MKLFADHCVHNDVVAALRNSDFQVIKASDVNLSTASDLEIFSYAVKYGLVLLTADKNFGNPLVFNINQGVGIVIISTEQMSRDMMIKRTLEFFRDTSKEKLHAQIFIIEPSRTRTRKKIGVVELEE